MKPYVICHMVTTIDGKILTARWGGRPTTKSGAALFEATADTFGIGAWIVGTTTMKEFAGRPRKLKRSPRAMTRNDHIANAAAKSFAIGVDAKAVLRFDDGESDGDHIILLITEQAGDDYLAHLQNAGVSYLFCGRREVNLHTAMTKLRAVFKIKKLMLEGGGKFNGSMLHAGLVDEISQVIMPLVDGGQGIPSIFDIPGKPPNHAAAKLRVLSHKKLVGSVNWFRYRVVKSGGTPRLLG